MRLTEWTMEEQEQLIHFLTTNSWPFHGNATPERELIEKTIGEGGYESDDVKTFWVENEDAEKVGIVKIHDLQDEIPLFDLRIAETARGKGYGSKALKLVTEYVFSLPEKKIRLEGHTRLDNVAMRKTFERAGFVKEAQLRQAWFSPKEERYYDAVTYGMTREDFLKGTSTPVAWDEMMAGATQTERPLVPDQLETERLLVRAPKLSDGPLVWEAISESMATLKPWMIWAQQTPKMEETEASLRKAIAAYVTQEDFRMHLFEKETGNFIGSTGFHRIDWSLGRFEIGYWLRSSYEGKGYITEAVQMLTDFAFREMKAVRVEIRCDEDNQGSRRVAERCGYELEGILRKSARKADSKEFTNTCIYAKIQ